MRVRSQHGWPAEAPADGLELLASSIRTIGVNSSRQMPSSVAPVIHRAERSFDPSQQDAVAVRALARSRSRASARRRRGTTLSESYPLTPRLHAACLLERRRESRSLECAAIAGTADRVSTAWETSNAVVAEEVPADGGRVRRRGVAGRVSVSARRGRVPHRVNQVLGPCGFGCGWPFGRRTAFAGAFGTPREEGYRLAACGRERLIERRSLCLGSGERAAQRRGGKIAVRAQHRRSSKIPITPLYAGSSVQAMARSIVDRW